MALLVASTAAAQVGDGALKEVGEGPETLVLEDVPYLGMDWQTHLDGPQDFTLASAMLTTASLVRQQPREPFGWATSQLAPAMVVGW